MVALYSISFAVSLFALPAIYHHLEYPKILIEAESSSFYEIRYNANSNSRRVLLIRFSIHLGFKSFNLDYTAIEPARGPFLFTRERK